jgi:EpsI family protein
VQLRDLKALVPAALLLLGIALVSSIKRQSSIPLEVALDQVVPDTLAGEPSRDQIISAEERRVSGVSNYLLRLYGPDSTTYRFSLYVGYYEQQGQGRSIHSPKNCLPGAGWEPLSSGTRTVDAGGRQYVVNRYLLANGMRKVLVYYWYQGRGRVASNEYSVKWDLLRDKALSGRSDEALVRIVVPILGTEAQADSVANAVASSTIPVIFRGLPGFPGRTA